MDVLVYLIPAALFLGFIGLGAFLWAIKTGQFEDMDGAAMRILIDDEDVVENIDDENCAPNSPSTTKSQ